MLDKYGLRVSILLGATGNAIGAWIKIFSTNPGQSSFETVLEFFSSPLSLLALHEQQGLDGFWITFVGQTIVGASQMFTLGIPPRLAAVWFGPNEVSTACAAGVFGNQVLFHPFAALDFLRFLLLAGYCYRLSCPSTFGPQRHESGGRLRSQQAFPLLCGAKHSHPGDDSLLWVYSSWNLSLYPETVA